MRSRALAVGLALIAACVGLVGCASNDPRDRMLSVHGLATEVTVVVELGKAPPDPHAILAASNEAAVALLGHLDPVTDRALARFDAAREPEQTKIERSQVTVELETPRVRADEASATRQEPVGKVVRFRFTVRRLDAKLATDPLRIEVPLTVLEDSRAPSDTLTFPQDFRAELLDELDAAVAEAARGQGAEPVTPRPVPTR